MNRTNTFLFIGGFKDGEWIYVYPTEDIYKLLIYSKPDEGMSYTETYIKEKLIINMTDFSFFRINIIPIEEAITKLFNSYKPTK